MSVKSNEITRKTLVMELLTHGELTFVKNKSNIQFKPKPDSMDKDLRSIGTIFKKLGLQASLEKEKSINKKDFFLIWESSENETIKLILMFQQIFEGIEIRKEKAQVVKTTEYEP